MHSKGVCKLPIAIAVVVASVACCGCNTLQMPPVTLSRLQPSADVATRESIHAVKKNAEVSQDGVGEQVQRGRGQWAEFMSELNRFFTFGDPEEMNSSRFDPVSDKQMKAMRTEIKGGSSLH